jgi:hypothetical protein
MRLQRHKYHLRFRLSSSAFLCYPVQVPMTKFLSITKWRSQKALTSLLSVVLLLAVNASLGAKCQARENCSEYGSEWLPATSIGSQESPRRNHALTTVPGQRVAGDISKQNRVKHSVTHNSLAPRKVGTPVAIVRQRMALTNQSALHLSFRLSRPGGRAPPASA